MDQFYENKCEELYGHIHQILNKKEENILQLRLKIAKTVNLQQIIISIGYSNFTKPNQSTQIYIVHVYIYPSSIFHITENGNIKEIIKYKHKIHLFEMNKLIISTNDSINFHHL
jgi:hypothetical protein